MDQPNCEMPMTETELASHAAAIVAFDPGRNGRDLPGEYNPVHEDPRQAAASLRAALGWDTSPTLTELLEHDKQMGIALAM